MSDCKKKTPCLSDPIKAFGTTTGHSDEMEGSEQENGLGGGVEGAKKTSPMGIPLLVGLKAPVDIYKKINVRQSSRSSSLPPNLSSNSEKGKSTKGRQRMSTPSSLALPTQQELPSAVPSPQEPNQEPPQAEHQGVLPPSPLPEPVLLQAVPQPEPQPQVVPQAALPQAAQFASMESVATLYTTSLPLCQALGIRDEDLCKFKSKEMMTTLHRNVLLKPTRKSHSWHCKIPVTVAGKKHVIADIFIDPSIGDDEQRAVLCVKAEMKKTKLDQSGEDSWLYVETQVTDSNGKGHGCSDFYPHPVKNNTWNFYQDLVKCEEVRSCGGNEVTLVINVTLITSQKK